MPTVKKIGVLWNSPRRDKNGKPYMNGVIDKAVALGDKQKVFVFQTDKRGPKSPVATIVVMEEGEERYAPPLDEEQGVGSPPPEDDAPPLEGEPPF